MSIVLSRGLSFREFEIIIIAIVPFQTISNSSFIGKPVPHIVSQSSYMM